MQDPTLATLAMQAAQLDAKTIASMRDQMHRTATNAKLSLESLRTHLVTATCSPERVAEELSSLEERIQKELTTHKNSMRQLGAMVERWSQPPEIARQQIAEARSTAVEAAKNYRAIETIAKLHNVGTEIASGGLSEFAELLGE